MREGVWFLIFVFTDSTETFFSNLRSAGFNYNLQVFSLTLTVRGVSNKHCLLTFFILSVFEWPLKTGFTVLDITI